MKKKLNTDYIEENEMAKVQYSPLNKHIDIREGVLKKNLASD